MVRFPLSDPIPVNETVIVQLAKAVKVEPQVLDWLNPEGATMLVMLSVALPEFHNNTGFDVPTAMVPNAIDETDRLTSGALVDP